MACAKCDFYAPKDSTQAQLLEAKASLQRMNVEIPLSDEERAAVDDGQDVFDGLIARLADTPTPAGLSAGELSAPPKALPIVAISGPGDIR